LTAAPRLRWPARPGYWSRPFAAARTYRWQAGAAFPSRLYQQYPGRNYYRFGQRPFFPAFTPREGTPRWGYWDRWGRWRRRYPFGKPGYAASAYAEPEPPYAEPPEEEPPYAEPPFAEPVVVPPPMAPPPQPAMAQATMAQPMTAQPTMMEPPAAQQTTIEPGGAAQLPPAQDQPTAGEFAIEPESFEFDSELDEHESRWGYLEGSFGEYEGPPAAATACPPYQRGEVEKSRTQQGHLPLDVIRHPRGLLIADFGVDWRTPRAALRANPELRAWLNELIQVVAANPSTRIRISGYSDCVGRENNNSFLRRGRAQRVLQLLRQLARSQWGLLGPRIKAGAAPAGDYVADNATAEGRAQNRGVLIEHTRAVDMQPTVITAKKINSPFARSWEGPSAPLDALNKFFDAFTLVDMGLAIAGVAATEAFMLGAGIVIAPLAPLVAVAAPHEAALNEQRKRQMLEGLSRGIVLGADGRSNKWIIEHGFVKKWPDRNIQYPAHEKELQNIYNASLVAGIAHGRQFSTVATKNLFTFVTSQMTDYAKREYLGYPNTMTADQWVAYSKTWSERKWHDYYRLVAAIVSRQIKFR
jgi:outer membrane protein OmpA-like peptidoglycan-associated protein